MPSDCQKERRKNVDSSFCIQPRSGDVAFVLQQDFWGVTPAIPLLIAAKTTADVHTDFVFFLVNLAHYCSTTASSLSSFLFYQLVQQLYSNLAAGSTTIQLAALSLRAQFLKQSKVLIFQWRNCLCVPQENPLKNTFYTICCVFSIFGCFHLLESDPKIPHLGLKVSEFVILCFLFG